MGAEFFPDVLHKLWCAFSSLDGQCRRHCGLPTTSGYFNVYRVGIRAMAKTETREQ